MADVIELKPRPRKTDRRGNPKPTLSTKERSYAPGECRHVYVEMNKPTARHRTVECADCKAQLDPFVVLYDYAVQERQGYWATQDAQRRVEELTREIEELTRQRNNLRAQVRRANGGERG